MKLTIPIPVHNTPPHHLLEAYYSVLNQDDGNDHRIVIVDDHSDRPDTLKCLRMLRSQVEVVRTRRVMGLAGALNWIHKTVDTEFIARMDSDDVSQEGRFRSQIEYLKNNPETDILGTNLFAFNDGDLTRKPLFVTDQVEFPEPRFIKEGDEPDKKTFWIVNHATVVYRKEVLDRFGGYNSKLKRKQDIELWERMIKEGGVVFRNLNGVYYAWRRYG